jgi:hypothetical protein
LPTARPSSLKPCTPVSFSSSATGDSAVFHNHVKPGMAARVASDHHAIDGVDEQPHFSPTIRIPLCSFTGLRAPTAPVKSLKVRCKSNLRAECRRSRPVSLLLPRVNRIQLATVLPTGGI